VPIFVIATPPLLLLFPTSALLLSQNLKKRRVGCGGLGDAEAPWPSTKLTPVAALRPTYLPP